ncbi:hypothetical protein [Naasia aerilata]|uniref:DUF8094 domain-containing protein n=1 Tax=Naasia aerilata TaxID=1162966 RepID=A0ABM8GDN6_9MICO|nr:hypothetical protein [Naasia aerilata]BDZ46387.1 hypothetical protein GCM10025866_22960 [Naasia aerilata]
MRFVSAIVAFVLAAAMIVFGIAQRTWLAPPDELKTSVATTGEAAFTVIPGAVLNSNPGQQHLQLSGGDTVWAAYARTSDIVAWLGTEPYNSISYNAKKDTLGSKLVETPAAEPDATAPDASGGDAAADGTAPDAAAPEAAAPNPAGSDLWLEEKQSDGALTWTMSVPKDVSLIVAVDGTAPAPSNVTLSWPLQHSTPWAGPLIVGGGILLLVGLGLYIWGLVHMRKTRGPRRKTPKLPQPPRPRVVRSEVLEPVTTNKGRRAARRTALATGGIVLTTGLLLSGCSSSDVDKLFKDDPAPVPTVTSSAAAAAAEEVQPVAVTEGQLRRILDRVSTTVAQADTDRNTDLLSTRLTGPALEERTANYAMRGADGNIAAPDAIPATPITLDLPQATDTWPRTVMTVVGGDDPAVAPVALVLVQKTPRDNYLVTYAVKLQAKVPFPAVAPPSVGAPLLPNDVKLLAAQPDQLGTEYADILAQGDASQFIDVFQKDPDGLRTNVGVDYKNSKKSGLPTTASLEFSNGPGSGPVLALASNDSGAIVATSIIERETAKVVEEGATINLEGQVKALSGLANTTKGVESTYGYQLLFYVPPTTVEGGQVVLLGYAQALIGVKEL